MLLGWLDTSTSHQLAFAQAAAQLTTVSTCPLLHTAGTHVGIAPQSLISFQVAPSKTAKCQSVALDGQTTSPLPHHPPHVATHVLPLYTFKVSFTVSYHSSHSYGSLGAVSDTTVSCASIYSVRVATMSSTSHLK